MTSLLAFLHHVAAFVLFAAIFLELVLAGLELNVKTARKILIADAIVGISAGTVLVAGLLRVFYFEKGAAYYFHSMPFLVKLSLFVIIALLSIYPTVQFLSWRKPLKEEKPPVVDERKMRLIRSILHWELVGMVILILSAVLMARGVGQFG